MRAYAQRGLDYGVVLAEIEAQRPFNTGRTEARQIRDRSHPLFSLEIAVNSLSGLPSAFLTDIEAFATETEVEYTVLGAIDEGINDIEAIRERVRSNVRALPDNTENVADEAIDRLVTKRIIERDGETVLHR